MIPLDVCHAKYLVECQSADADDVAVGTRDVPHEGSLGGIERERLLDQDVLPCLQGQNRVLGVGRVRRRDVDDVHLRISDEVFVGPVCVGDAEFGCECGSGVRPARSSIQSVSVSLGWD